MSHLPAPHPAATTVVKVWCSCPRPPPSPHRHQTGAAAGCCLLTTVAVYYTNNAGTNINITELAGDLSGPGSSTDDRAVLFNGTTGKLVKNSTLHIDAANTGVLLDASNTPGAPRYSFASDTTTGMYRVGANALGFSTGGVLRMTVNAGDVTLTTPLRTPFGSAASPSLALSGGGVYGSSTGNNGVGFASGGATGLTLNANSNVAIGGGTPLNYGNTTGGEGVVFIHEAAAVPTGATTGGISLYNEGDALKAMTTAGSTPLNLTACVEGPASSTDTAIVRFDGTDGDLVKNSVVKVTTGSDRVRAPDGSAALPTYAFSGDTTTGFYLAASGDTGFSTDGVNRLTVGASSTTSTNKILYTSGTEAAPGIRFTGDTDTGLYLEGSSSVGVSSGGGAGLVVSPDANVSLAGGEASSYGSGEGVVFINQATTNPSTNPTSSGLLYVPSGDVDSLAYRDTAGTVTTITSRLEAPVSSTDRAIVRWDGVSGRVVQNSSTTITAAGEVLAADGSAAAPTYSFAGDTDTGMFLASADTLRLSVGGSSELTVNSEVQSDVTVDIPDGVLLTPALSFTSDTNTGLFRSGADTVQFVAGGSAGMTVTFPAATTQPNVTLGSANVAYGATTAGERVVLVEDVSVAPSGTASGGGRFYVSGTTPTYHDDLGGIVDLLNITSGPASSTTNAIARYDGTGGKTIQNTGILIAGTESAIQPPTSTAASPTFAFNASTTTGVYFPSTTSIALSTAGTDRVTMSSAAVTIPSQDLQADAGVEVGGATGASYSLSAANMIADIQNASGSFAWSNSTDTIMTTSGTNLSLDNNLVFTEGTETFDIGNNGTSYDFGSNGTTPKDIVFSAGGSTILNFNETDNVEFSVDITSLGRFACSGTGGTTDYNFSVGADTNRGMTIHGTTAFGFASAPGVYVYENHVVALSGNITPNANSGSGVVHVRNSTSIPTTATSGTGLVMYTSDSGVRGFGAVDNAGTSRTIFDSYRERANITLSSFTVSTASSTNTDGQTWTEVDNSGVVGTTTGEMMTGDDVFVTFTATAEWASNSTGYRRLTIMRKTAGPTYTKLNGVLTSAVNGTVTAQTVSFFGSVDASADELTVQVEQTSGGDLDVDLTATFVRYTTNEAV